MQHQPLDQAVSKVRSWSVVLVAGLFFFYEFIQMNMFDTISQVLIHVFSLDAMQLGILSSVYFAANVVFLFIAGVLLDRYSTKCIIIVSLLVCIVGTFLFSFASGFVLALVSRFFTGIGSAFCFLSVIRLASRWFEPRKMAFVLGVVVTMAMTGGLVSQTPMAYLVEKLQWREAMRVDAYFGIIILLLIVIVVKDFPINKKRAYEHEQQEIKQLSYLRSWRLAFSRIQNWLGGLYTSSMNLPINVLGGLWGILYLTQRYKMTQMHASNITMSMFLGSIIGCSVMGWWSDKLGLRRPLMIVGAICCFILSVLLVYLPHLSVIALFALFFALGFCSSAQVIGYPLVSENSPRLITATSVSIVNITTIAGIGIIQSVFGYFVDLRVYHRLHHMSSHYVYSDFSLAILLFPLGYIIALLMSLLIKETYCQQNTEVIL